MHDIGIGDVLFILLVLGIVHGIMYWVASLKRADKKKSSESADPET